MTLRANLRIARPVRDRRRPVPARFRCRHRRRGLRRRRLDPAEPVVVDPPVAGRGRGAARAPKRTLGLSKVVVMPGAVLASHHHPGAQLGYVAEGVLTYTVETGSRG